MNTYQRQLGTLQKDFDQKVMALAHQVRTDLIVPLCKKHGLEFLSGNGMFCFTKGERDAFGIANMHISESSEYSNGEDNVLYRKYKIARIFEILNLEVHGNQVLGYYVSDVRTKDLHK